MRNERQTFVVRVRATKSDPDVVRSLWRWLKIGLRTFGLRCTYIAEKTEEVSDKRTTTTLTPETSLTSERT
jgi:hypothetical protein